MKAPLMQLSLSTQYLAQVHTKHNITCCKLVDADNTNVILQISSSAYGTVTIMLTYISGYTHHFVLSSCKYIIRWF